MAHQLFHRDRKINYFIDRKDKPGRGKTYKKREAEVFAAYFVIPEEKPNTILKEDELKNLQTQFQVSENFMKKRLEFENKKR